MMADDQDFRPYSNLFRVCETYTELPDVLLSFSPNNPIAFKFFSPLDPLDACPCAPLSCDHSNLGAFCISTYPVLPGKPHRSGHPIADVFGLVIQDDGSIVVALADGCNWGVKSREAARAASHAFLEYVLARKPFWFGSTALHLGHLLLRGFSTAHDHILNGVEQNLSEAGTTTLLGVLLSPMLDSPDWLLLTCSVGDTKAFLYNPTSHTVYEISGPQQRCNAADPGGRLGPHLEPHGEPDLRNLYLQSTKASPGDLLLLLTDGVYDNLDPMYQGVSPGECGLECERWEEGDELHHEVRTTYIRRFLRDRFICHEGRPRAPQEVCDLLSKYLLDITEASRDFHQTQPNKKLPRDFVKYPGKMDHSTAICIAVPAHAVKTGGANGNAATQSHSIPILLNLSSSADSEDSSTSKNYE